VTFNLLAHIESFLKPGSESCTSKMGAKQDGMNWEISGLSDVADFPTISSSIPRKRSASSDILKSKTSPEKSSKKSSPADNSLSDSENLKALNTMIRVKQHKRTMPKEFELLATLQPTNKKKKKKLQSLKDIWCKKLKDAALLMLANSILPDIKRRRIPPSDAPKLPTSTATPQLSIKQPSMGNSTPSSKPISKEQLRLKLTSTDDSSGVISLDSSSSSTSSSSALPFESQKREIRKSAARKSTPSKNKILGNKAVNKKRKFSVAKPKTRKKMKIGKISSSKTKPLKRSAGVKGVPATKKLRKASGTGGKRKTKDKSAKSNGTRGSRKP